MRDRLLFFAIVGDDVWPWRTGLFGVFAIAALLMNKASTRVSTDINLRVIVFPFSLSIRSFRFDVRVTIGCRIDPIGLKGQSDVHLGFERKHRNARAILEGKADSAFFSVRKCIYRVIELDLM